MSLAHLMIAEKATEIDVKQATVLCNHDVVVVAIAYTQHITGKIIHI